MNGQLSVEEIAVATVAKWPFCDRRYPTQSRSTRPTATRRGAYADPYKNP